MVVFNPNAFTFAVGYHPFHKNKHINFQLNRWYSFGYWTEADARQAGARVRDISNWKPVLVALAEQMQADDRVLPAAMAYRAAEFFTHPADPDKLLLYDQFCDLFYTAVPQEAFQRHSIPYPSGFLSALQFTPPESKGTIVIHGGLDSFIEEFFLGALYMAAAGYEIILFEGPGQGAALRQSGLLMTHEWEHAVTAVLDYFALTDVTLVGISLGGYLALRAAAFEERVSRIVAFDVFIYDQHGSGLQGALYQLFLRYPSLYNWVAGTAMRWSVAANHLISQWMYVTGTNTPADWIAQVQHYSVSDIAAQVRQDVLLLAGAEDHMIPLREYENNRQGLTQARSVTGRIFTAEEQAHNHCQVGNLKLALDVILEWIDEKSKN